MKHRQIMRVEGKERWQKRRSEDYRLCPAWQRPARSTMAYVAGERKLFLLESSALDSNGEEMRSKHVPLEGQYQLGEFHHLRNELRKYSTKFEYSECCLQHLILCVCACGCVHGSTFHTAQQIFIKQCPWKKDRL